MCNPQSGRTCTDACRAMRMEAPVDMGRGDIRLSREFDVTSTNSTAITLDCDGDHKGQILSSVEIIEDSAGASCLRGVLRMHQ
jgi:hypothetical protein